MTTFNPQINRECCTGCQSCIDACPTDALSQYQAKAFLSRPDACVYCLLCEDICPVGAIELPFLVIRKTEE
jgi:NAD-dependent dihydropyrimidine dehydrogenase PreA subunit